MKNLSLLIKDSKGKKLFCGDKVIYEEKFKSKIFYHDGCFYFRYFREFMPVCKNNIKTFKVEKL